MQVQQRICTPAETTIRSSCDPVHVGTRYIAPPICSRNPKTKTTLSDSLSRSDPRTAQRNRRWNGSFWQRNFKGVSTNHRHQVSCRAVADALISSVELRNEDIRLFVFGADVQ